MTERNSFRSWWDDVPEAQKPALKTLAVIFLAVLSLAAVSTLYLQLS